MYCERQSKSCERKAGERPARPRHRKHQGRPGCIWRVALALAIATTGALAQENQPDQKPPALLAPSMLPKTRVGITPARPEPPPKQKDWRHSKVPPDAAFAAFQRGRFITAFKEAMKRIEAKKDDAAAMTLIAELYKDGLGFRQDPAEAARWYKLAAAKGDRQAAFALGRAYLQGAGVPKDKAKARSFFQTAARRNHGAALYNLGILAMESKQKGKFGDFVKAAEYFRKAAAQGDIDAVYSLAIMHRRGIGVPFDRIKSTTLLKRAADRHHISAVVQFAIARFNGAGIARDEKDAVRYFIRAAWRNAPIAQNRLARLYASGRGVKKDMVQAMKWHIIARASGIKDKWLDDKLRTLTRTQRKIVDAQVRKFASRK